MWFILFLLHFRGNYGKILLPNFYKVNRFSGIKLHNSIKFTFYLEVLATINRLFLKRCKIIVFLQPFKFEKENDARSVSGFKCAENPCLI